MKKGKELGYAIAEAIELKIKSGQAGSKSEIAKHFNVKPPAIYTWIRSGSISKEKLPELFRYFSDVVDAGHWGLSQYGDFGGISTEQNERVDRVPLYKIPEWNEVKDIHSHTPERFVVCPSDDAGENVYAIICRDDSMLNSHNNGSLCRGDILFIDPDVEPEREDFVFATSSVYHLASVKQLIEQDGRRMLYTSNPTWQERFILIDETIQLHGTVIAKSHIYK